MAEVKQEQPIKNAQFKIVAKPLVRYDGVQGLEKMHGTLRRVKITDELVVIKLILKRDCDLIPLNKDGIELVTRATLKSALISKKVGAEIVAKASKALDGEASISGTAGKPVSKPKVQAVQNNKKSGSGNITTK